MRGWQYANGDQYLYNDDLSAVHKCEGCDRILTSKHALDQHLNSPAHASIPECAECDREFGSQ